jgi:hypothetical protein
MNHSKEPSYKRGDVVYVSKDSFGVNAPGSDKAMIVQVTTSCFPDNYVVGRWVEDVFDEFPKWITCDESMIYRM